jgi:hypothetical protein
MINTFSFNSGMYTLGLNKGGQSNLSKEAKEFSLAIFICSYSVYYSFPAVVGGWRRCCGVGDKETFNYQIFPIYARLFYKFDERNQMTYEFLNFYVFTKYVRE